MSIPKNDGPKITFGIIVVNGEPFTRYCLRSLYPFAHEIIVVEGGHEGARPVCTPEGHSIDTTLETLWRFKSEEDPEDKVQIVTRDGFWPQKDELGRDRTPQSRAYAERATGDYLWQVDIDEFYRAEDVTKIIELLRSTPDITAISFKGIHFWGSLDYFFDGWLLRRGYDVYHRLFKWKDNYKYITHEPPTVYDNRGRDVRTINWVTDKQTDKMGIKMFHYTLLFPSQVRMKAALYQNEKPNTYDKLIDWAEKVYFRLENPWRVHDLYEKPSWLCRYRGQHPAEIYTMIKDINDGVIDCTMRDMEDVQSLLKHLWYIPIVNMLKVGEYLDRSWWEARRRAGELKKTVAQYYNSLMSSR